MSMKPPIFHVAEPQHFGDYGFDPQISYFQVLKEGKEQKRKNSKIKNKIKWWWKNALIIFKWFPQANKYNSTTSEYNSFNDLDHHVHHVHHRTGSITPYRTTSWPSFVPLARTSTPDEVEIPYISLRELNMDQPLPCPYIW
ncbi:hypothetical protein Adt_08004 [Abeliophyllum distichum]|uniref:Uncharacterized protein n=1 Tax=Abeliophyllum distichum TaxID=126358 RepID=A0ABD1VCT3_9LAMI